MASTSELAKKLARVIKRLVESGTWAPGDMAAQCDMMRVPRVSYATACAMYEATRRSGRDAALCDDARLELCRRTWGRPAGCSL